MKQVQNTMGGGGRTFFPSSFEETQADALLTQRKGVSGSEGSRLSPVIFFDPEREALALLHAGWRGIIQGIHLRVAQAMKNLFSSSILNWWWE